MGYPYFARALPRILVTGLLHGHLVDLPDFCSNGTDNGIQPDGSLGSRLATLVVGTETSTLIGIVTKDPRLLGCVSKSSLQRAERVVTYNFCNQASGKAISGVGEGCRVIPNWSEGDG